MEKAYTIIEVRHLLRDGQYCEHERNHEVAVEVGRFSLAHVHTCRGARASILNSRKARVLHYCSPLRGAPPPGGVKVGSSTLLRACKTIHSNGIELTPRGAARVGATN